MKKQVITHHLIKLFFIIFLGAAATATLLFGIINWKTQTAKAASPTVAYWHLNETSGTTYVDAEAAAHNGTCTNCPSPIVGPINGAQSFDGIDDTIDVSSHSAFNWGEGDTFAVEFWMQANSCTTSNEVFMGRGTAAGEQWYVGCNGTNGTVQFYLSDNISNITLESTKVITDSNWHHLAATYDGPNDTAWLYVDGSDIISATTSFSGSISPSSANVNIGHVDNSMYFNGKLDEIAIYNDMPSLTDFRTHYYLTRGYTESCTNDVRIMPLGDSITQGYASGIITESLQISYRHDLWQLLTNNGYKVDYVGSRTHGQDYQAVDGFDPNHEGWPGWQDFEVTRDIYNNDTENWLGNSPADVILLHIGTNGMNGTTTDADDVEDILNEIDEYEADNNTSVTVILAKIINRVPNYSWWTDFNNNVTAMAEARIANGDKIIIVDMEAGAGLTYDYDYSGGDFHDYLHPSATGYTKMANIWYSELVNFMPYCPTPPTIASTPVTSGAKNAAYTYDVVARSNIQPVTYSLAVTPTGMTINSVTGKIQWTPAVTGTFNVTVEAANNVGTIPQIYTIAVDEPVSPTITSTAITTAVINEPYVYDVEATGIPSPTFSLDTAPGGMTIVTTTGRIEWTPTNTNPVNVTVNATNSTGTDPQSFTITVADAPVCPTNTSAYWHLDANIGNEFHESINDNDLTCTEGKCPSEVIGKVNFAANFDGTDDFLQLKDPSATTFNWQNSDSFSIELWVNTTQTCTTNKVFMGKYANNAPAWWIGCGNGGNATFSLRDSLETTYEFTHTMPINNGAWHHIVAIRDDNANENILYVDGVGQKISASYVGDFENGFPITVGNYDNAYYFEGMIDEAAIYNRVLADSEIQYHITNGAANTGYCTDVSPAFITSAPVTTVVIGEQYSYDVEATGFPIPEFFLTESQTGMTINQVSGLITWTPGSTGSYNVTVKASNTEGNNSQPFTIDVVNPTLPVITSAPVSSGYVNQLYAYNVDATGIPTPQYSLTISPTGMTIDPDSGLITWTPTETGTFNAAVVATNSAGSSAPQAIEIIVEQPVCLADQTSYWQFESSSSGIFADTQSVRDATCPTGFDCPQIVTGKVGNAATFDGINDALAVEGDQTPYNWEVSDSFSIELWVKTDQDCSTAKVLVGKNIISGASWWVGCTNNGGTGVATFSLRDSSGLDSDNHSYLVNSTTRINDDTDGTSWHHIVAMYDSSLSEIRLYVDGNVTTLATSFPVNENFSSGYPISIGHLNGSYLFEGLLDDVAIYERTLTEAEILQHYHNEVSYCASSAEPVIYSTAVTEVLLGTPYSYDVNAVGITAPTYSFEVTPPTGMTINTNTGLIEWTTPTIGDHSISVKASNPAGDDIQNYTLTVSEAPTISSTPVTIHELGGTYTYDVNADGYPGITYTVASNPVATGMSIDLNSGVISWNPSTTGIFNITVTAHNTAGQVPQNYDLTVGTKPTITSSPTLTGEAGTLYTYDVNAIGYPTPNNYALNSPPPGMTINSNTGLISWTPTSGGVSSVSVAVSNDIGTTLHNFSITVSAPPAIVSTAITEAIPNQLYEYDVEVTGYPAPTFSFDGTPPAGMTINANSGLITWTPSANGDYLVKVQASNGVGAAAVQEFTIEVNQNVIFLPLILNP